MAGRGRGGGGRGKGISFNVETLGFGRGEALPGPLLQPPPTFPMVHFKPVPLSSGEEQDYLLALKQELRTALRDSPYFIKPPEKKKDIERYSDKYHGQGNGDMKWDPDWSRLPAELKTRTSSRLKNHRFNPKANVTQSGTTKDDITKQLAALEQQEQDSAQEEDEKEEKEGEGAEGEEEEYYEEEILEEETDYNMTYFDNGENYGADEEDDVDEGPIY